ncbi:hypothetical protein ACP26O_18045 [Burkholderia sp. R-40]|uniref:hypothetical protein n=1 Tax=Burkholderia TaxID=32008 RepID=UPI001592FA01|nr:hypothetical protein [Burkholderia ambifaria]
MQTDTLFLLDRNVVDVIKEANAGNEQKGDKQKRMLTFLKSIDNPKYSISPLLSLIEGEHGREDSADEKIAQLHKETSAVASFFRHANTDEDYLKSEQEQFSKVFTRFREGNFDARAAFRLRAIPLVREIVSPKNRRKVEDQLLELARSAGLDHDDGVVVMFLACLYGNDAVRDMLKLKDPEKTYNVLSDIHLLPRIGLIKTVAKSKAPNLKVRLLTLDKGLEAALNNIRISAGDIVNETIENIGVRYLPPLFIGLSEFQARAMLNRLRSHKN